MSAEVTRPNDAGELARLVAVELRKRGIWADNDESIDAVILLRSGGVARAYYSMHKNDFDNLTPVEIADAIQREEAAKAQEWAGDT